MTTPHDETQAHIAAEIAAGRDPYGDDDLEDSGEEGGGEAPASDAAEPPVAQAAEVQEAPGDAGDPGASGQAAPAPAPAEAAPERAAGADGAMSAEEISAVLAAITPAQANALKIQIPDISGVDAKLAEIEAKADDVERRYMAGDIGDPERMAELRAISRERDSLNRKLAQAETVAYFVQQQAISAQQEILDGLVRSAKADGIDYEADTDAQVEFNAALKTAEAMPRLAGKPPAEIYSTAHRMVLAARGIAPATQGTQRQPTAGAAGAPARTPPPMPPSIRGLPTAAAQTQGHGLDDVLRNSRGSDFDVKWARMTEDQRRAYLDD